MYASMPDKIQQEFISKVGNAFIFYHIVVIDIYWISRIQYDGFFALEPLVMAYQLWI